MKRILTPILALAALCATAQASPFGYTRTDDFYFGARTGVNMLADSTYSSPFGGGDIDFKTGFGMGIAAGYRFLPNWRLDLEYGYSRAKLHTARLGGGTFRMSTVMLNLYYDHRIAQDLDWYAGLGFGMGWTDMSFGGRPGVAGSGGSDDDWVLAYQMMTGFNYRIADGWSMLFGYRLSTGSRGSYTIPAGKVKAKTPWINTFEIALRYEM